MMAEIDKSNTATVSLAEWRLLFRVASISLFMVVALTAVQIVVYSLSVPPDNVTGFYELLGADPIRGLLSLDLIMLVDYVLQIPIILALYVSLRGLNPSLVLMACALALVGVTVYFASTVAFEMLDLANQYAVAVTDAQRSQLVGAGQALMAGYQGTAFDSAYVMLALAYLLISWAMLKSQLFGKKIAIIGLVMAALMLLPPTAGMVGKVVSFLSLLPMVVWYVLLGSRFWKAGRG